MTFEEHLANCVRGDGTYDLALAETRRAEELAENPGTIEKLARAKAQQERKAWETRETERLRKQFVQSALDLGLDMEVKVPIGDNTAVRYGEMNRDRIRLRKDLRTTIHLRETRAFDAEMTHWFNTEALLDPGETIEEALRR